ncbi:Hsp33 family molecular chaperone HslO [Aliikangiella sp. IMCC44359]|uniref:Hsp33 family molecular chaperone HslO n=1 Tax=Aliikangiella sp. IMCC44359 TaxID=3459125 RepID=UPI00403B2790
MSDTIHRFIFETDGIRGQLVKLNQSAQKMLNGHNYPPLIADLLTQAASINVLLATTLKFEGKISLQLQTPDKLKMLVVQTTHDLNFRGLARYDDDIDYSTLTFKDLTRKGHLSITIEPSKGKRYQGIVPLDGTNLSQCVENYFEQSEQLKTRIWLFTEKKQACGLLLQALPDMISQEAFMHLNHLASTLNKEEALTVESEMLLHRLFHQEDIRYLSVDDIHFACGCSRKKMLDSLSLLPEKEVTDILQTEGLISVKCEFCLEQFNFKELDIKEHNQVSGNNTKH